MSFAGVGGAEPQGTGAFHGAVGTGAPVPEGRDPNATLHPSDDGEDVVPYTGVDEERMRELARQVTRSSWNSEHDTENPFAADRDPRLDPNSPEFSSAAFARNMNNIFRQDRERYPAGELGVSFRNMSAYGYGANANFQRTVGNAVWASALRLADSLRKGTANRVDILKPMDGLVKPGEMLVVLGRPGSGCSTFLRTMASQTYGFKLGPDSQLNYMGLSIDKVSHQYRGDVTYCAESELHFPQMTVGDTLSFVSRLKAPANRIPGVSAKEYAQVMRDVIMATFGLSHTVNTLVGNEFIRGVSGGERKRVSIAELALCGSALQCWDNSTRGLDSATALEFIRTLRTGADVFNTTALVAVYQASEEMYALFDKTIVLYEGYQIFYGNAADARRFFYEMGWQPKPRQPTPDFLTSLSSPNEREARPGFEEKVPRSAEEFHQRWVQSDLYRQLIGEIDQFNQEYPLVDGADEQNSPFVVAYRARKAKSLPNSVAYTVGWWDQIKILCIRGFQRIKGDPTMPATSVFGNSIMGLIIASMFFNLQMTTGSFYSRTALLFFSVLFNAMNSLLEIFALYQARPIVQKHHQYALYHPATDAIASIMTEMPVKLITSITFNLVIYFLPHLRRTAGQFFFYWLISFMTTLCMSHIFRTIGAVTNSFEEAMIPANVVLLALIFFTGFVIPTRNMHKWCRWINYLDPVGYAYEALVANEFHNGEYKCTQFLPEGPPGSPYGNLSGRQHVCSSAGAQAGQTTILGDDYILAAYRYTWSHAWRNFGILLGFTIFFLAVYMYLVWANPGARTKGEVLVFPYHALRKKIQLAKRNGDLESGGVVDLKAVDTPEDSVGGATEDDLIESSTDVFYWKDLVYDIKIKGEPRRLLNFVDGWVKPGTLTALMGASGAGKTTLLDTLANRVTMGVVQGQIYVNGIPRDNSFQRSTGYAMQQDIHLSTSTVRESLVFSALMRQPYETPYEEKLRYVDNVLKILEMEPYADAVVGIPGEGLNVEQRKRLTIGVELAAKPKLLLFLDEPTSGLDSQTAWSICQLLKKLSTAGQAILCTIHQPSALLLQQFDRLLFLAKGGRTVYFGDIGPNSSTLTGYFEKYGADPISPDANPAEWMLHVIGAAPGSHANHDYADVWLHSEERQAVRAEISSMMEKYQAAPTNKAPDADHVKEFAVPFWYQYLLVSKRTFQQQWRTPTYIYSKIGLSVFSAIFNGFVFFKADNSIQGLQDLMFSIFMFTPILNSIVQQYLPSFVLQRTQYETRERPSKMFNWKAFIFAQITAEVPWQVFCSVLAFACWYWPVGLYENAKYTHTVVHRSGMTYLYILFFYLFATTLGQLLIAGLPDADTASNVAVMLFTMTLMFCGVLVTRKGMPGFWQFMYRVSPMTYWIQGMLSLAIHDAPVRCRDYEFVAVDPPSGMTCSQYLQPFFDGAKTGYVSNGDATSNCQICAMSTTNLFLESVEALYSQRWRNIWIFFCFIVINLIGCVVIYYIARVPKSSSRVKNETTAVDPRSDQALVEAGNSKEDYESIARTRTRDSARTGRSAAAADLYGNDEKQVYEQAPAAPLLAHGDPAQAHGDPVGPPGPGGAPTAEIVGDDKFVDAHGVPQ